MLLEYYFYIYYCPYHFAYYIKAAWFNFFLLIVYYSVIYFSVQTDYLRKLIYTFAYLYHQIKFPFKVKSMKFK